MATRIRRTRSDVVITDTHARGLVREFLEKEAERAHETRLRRMRLQFNGARTVTAAHHILDAVDKAWSPLSIASYSDTGAAGRTARRGILYIETDPGSSTLLGQAGVAACSVVKRYQLQPRVGSTIDGWDGHAAFTQHALERLMQRCANRTKARIEIGVAAIIANERLHELAVARGFRRTIVPGLTGVFVGDFEPTMPYLRFDTFLPVDANTRGQRDLLTQLAAAVWIDDRFRLLMPALFHASEPCKPMDDVLEIYVRQERLMTQESWGAEDWFAKAVMAKYESERREAR